MFWVRNFSGIYVFYIRVIILYLTLMEKANKFIGPQQKQSASRVNEICSDYSWCSYEAVDNFSITVQWFILSMLILTSVILTKYFLTVLRYRKKSLYHRSLFGNVFLQVYAIVFLWNLSCLIKVGINIGSFYFFMNQNPDEYSGVDTTSPVFYLSLLFGSFDNSATFFINHVIILIVYQWLAFSLLQIKDDHEINIPIEKRKILRYLGVTLKGVWAFLYFRLLLLFIYFLEPIITTFVYDGCKFSRIIVYYRIGESICILLFFAYGLYSAFNMKKYSLIKIKNSEFQKLKIQYLLLMASDLARIFMNIVFKIYADQIFAYAPGQDCYDSNSDNNLKRGLSLLFAIVVMHLLPIGVVLFIYNPNLNEKSFLKKSIQYYQTLEDGNSN